MQRMVLSRRDHTTIDGQMGKKCGNLFLAHIHRMPVIGKQNKPSHPIHVRLHSTRTVVKCSHLVAVSSPVAPELLRGGEGIRRHAAFQPCRMLKAEPERCLSRW